MSQALALSSRPVALETYELLRDLDPTRWRRDLEDALRQRTQELATQIRQLLTHETAAQTGDASAAAEAKEEARETAARRQIALEANLTQMATVLSTELPAAELASGERRAAWNGFRQKLQVAYEALSRALKREAVAVPVIRPTNYLRSGVHVMSGLFVLFLVERVLNDSLRLWIPLAFAAASWFMEAMRHYTDPGRRFLLWVFGPIAHPHERYRVNSSTWYGTALLVMGAFFSPLACALGVINLAIGDPMAGLVGRKFGRTPLVANRSLEGTLAFVVFGTIASLAVMILLHPQLPAFHMVALAVGVSASCAAAELFSGRRVDDNFSVPVAGAVATWAIQLMLA